MCENKTEQDVINLLEITCKKYTPAPKIIVVKREVIGGVARKVTFACVVNRNLDGLIDELIFQSIDEDFDFEFVASEINLQENMDVDYIYITAEITARKGS